MCLALVPVVFSNMVTPVYIHAHQQYVGAPFTPHSCQPSSLEVWILIASSNREFGRRLLISVTWMEMNVNY